MTRLASLGNIVVVAQQMLDKLGRGAPEIIDLRAVAHEEEGDAPTAAYWHRVAKAARHLLSFDATYLSPGQGPRPIVLPAETYRQVFEAVTQPSLLLQPNLVVVDVNPIFLELSGLQRLDMLGADLFSLFPDNPADGGKREMLMASLLRVLDTGAPDHMGVFRYDVRNRAGKFEERWWETINAPVLDDMGRISYILHQTREVTESVKAGH